MAKRNITTDDLARMIKKGFDETATKTQVFALEKRMNNVENRLENIEKILLKQHGDQIQNLERRVRYMEELFAVRQPS